MYQFFFKFTEYLGSCFKNEHNLNWFMWVVFYKVFCKLHLLQSTTCQIWAIPDKTGLSERVIVDGHGCHTALHFGVKAKENQDKVPTLYWLPQLHKKKPIKQDLLQILVLVRQQNFLNC